jgi:hypothetical protein
VKEFACGRTSSNYHLTTKTINLTEPQDPRASVLISIFRAHAFLQSDSHTIFEAAYLVPRHHVHADETILYDMADAGLIRYITEARTKLVGFGNPLIYYEILRERVDVSALELAALCSPRGPYMETLAEESCRRLLAKAFHTDPSNPDPLLCDGPFSTVAYSCDALNLTPKGKAGNVSFSPFVSYKENLGGRDALGADSVVLAPFDSSNSAFIAYRIQIKLGKSLIGTEADKSVGITNIINTAEEIGTNFCSRKQLAEDAYRSSIPLASMHMFLATTRQITPNARTHLLRAGVVVLDSRWLSKNVWPDGVWPDAIRRY